MSILKILIADDSAVTRKLIGKMISETRFKKTQIFEAANGTDAIKILAEQNIDLLLTDWMMPGVDGIEMIQKIKASPKHKNLEIIMITKEKTVEKMESALALGITNFIGKPFTVAELDRKIFYTSAGRKYYSWGYSFERLRRRIFCRNEINLVQQFKEPDTEEFEQSAKKEKEQSR